MKINCIQFTSVAVLKEFIQYTYPFVVEEMDTILCGAFTDVEIAIALTQFNASLLGTTKGKSAKQ